ncbi:MAG: L-aspartate oxidase [Pseudonocardiales bacterium]|nr:L-aspartate oxidase [Pseudonocardiales bacterium]MBV9729152.1 L-aspartate oxidase [Pseudonocardiales bacterium]
MTNWHLTVDLAVVGTGVAGLTAALRAAELGLRVVAVTKTTVEDGNTRWAQGGVAVVLPGTGDSVEAHVADTLAAGAGLCDEVAVRAILAAGPAAVSVLRARGAVFDGSAGELERTREGGHRAFRVIHAAGDATGAEIERALAGATRGGQLPLLEGRSVTDVLRDDTGRVAGLALLGDYLGDGWGAGVLRTRAVLLATGGLGQLYAVSTNVDGATGDGLALALRAGAMTADLEFVQFHPTVLHVGPGSRGRQPLVTEAIRGEGAVLLDITGSPVMTGVHPLGALAPRDVVAAAITSRMAQTGTDHVLLDATHLGAAVLRRRFPTVHAACMALGVDPARAPIPVAPAAHYQCGGVVTDTSGRTTVPGLYAAGEVARTGLHGANRLASNSLLEGLVMGARAAEAVAADLAVSQRPGPPLPPCERRPVAARDAVQRSMSAHAGIGRDAAGLAAASAVARATLRRLRTPRDAENAGLTLAAAAVLAAASARTESRGCHLRTDHPRTAARWRRSITVVLDDAGAPVVAQPMLVGGVA